MSVDFEFIEKLEGCSLVGYVPDYEHSDSGVTIASGFDIGQRSRRFIKKNFSSELAVKLVPYCGVYGLSAKLMTNFLPLSITQNEAQEINLFVQSVALKKLKKNWNKAASVKFDSLSQEQQTVVASVAFQYGTLRTETPNFWRQVTTGDWFGALNNLRDFGDRYNTRRNKEADLLERYLKKERQTFRL